MKLKDSSILVVDDDVDVLTAMSMFLKSQVKEVVTEKNPVNLISLLKRKNFDLVILDMNFDSVINTGNEGLFWLNKISEVSEKINIILITAYGDMDLAIKSLKNGASDFLVKPWKNEKLLEAIVDILNAKMSGTATKWSPQVGGVELLWESGAMKDVFFKINKIAPTDANILILGENGTGKELVARAIHDNSFRKNKPFIKVDVGALTSTLFESELFGHKKGAFTDAKEDRKGRFEEANGGTLFLDEIGNISLQQQAKLLTVLQNREITPLGTNEAVVVDIRLICATNVGLEKLVDENHFRKDLIYRINTVDIIIPPLRERNKDIALLANHFIELYTEKYLKGNVSLDESFLKKLNNHTFPGNVRELQYAMERAVIMADSDILTKDDLIFSPLESRSISDQPADLKLDSVQKNAISNVIEKNNGNITRSAKELGITRTALYRRIKKYDL